MDWDDEEREEDATDATDALLCVPCAADEPEDVTFDPFANMQVIIKGRSGPFGEVPKKRLLVHEVVLACQEQSFKDCVSGDAVLASEVAAVGVRFSLKKTHSADALSEMLVDVWRALETRDLMDKIKDWRQGNKPLKDFVAKMIGVAASARAAVLALDAGISKEGEKGIFVPFVHGLTGLKAAGRAFPTCPGCRHNNLVLRCSWEEVEAANTAKAVEHRQVQAAFDKDGVGRLGTRVKACPAAQKATDMIVQCMCSVQHCGLRAATNKACVACWTAQSAGSPIPTIVEKGLTKCTCPICGCNCVTALNVSSLASRLLACILNRPATHAQLTTVRSLPSSRPPDTPTRCARRWPLPPAPPRLVLPPPAWPTFSCSTSPPAGCRPPPGRAPTLKAAATPSSCPGG